MENPQAQMPQGQPGQAPEQMQQGAPQGQPQQGGQDPQMQQIMQLVQQMMQQGAQPADAAAELLAKQVPPEMIMQVFVQMGMPEQDAQAAIEQAMQGGQQPQNPGEEQMEGQASNPQEEMAEQGAPAPDQGGQPSPAEEIQMRYGGGMPRRLRSYAAGGDNQELQAVMQKVQEMMSQGSDARQVMEQIQAAAQQGQISPETATSVMEQLSGMQQATDPQGSDVAMTEGSQDPQALDPNVPAPDSAMGMAKFGGNLKKLMSRAYGGPAVAPGTDSKTYAKDRTSMFVGAVKNSAYKSTLDDEFPSLGGNQMAYGGDLPKAANGIIMKDGKLTIDPTQFKSEAEYKAAALDWNMDPNNANNQVTGDLLKTNSWKEPEFKAEAGKQYELDATTGKLKAVEAKTINYGQASDWRPSNEPGIQMTYVNSKGEKIGANQYNQQFGNQQQYMQGYGAINPVAYQNPMGNTFWDNVNAGASPFARMMSGIGTNNMYDPRITGANLPGGMNANQFLGAVGANGLVPGMAGNVAGQNWRVGEAEKFKEGSIWKGNRRKGVRYQIDWGDAAAMNPATQTQNQSASVPQIGTANRPSTPYPGYVDENGVNPAPAGTEMTTDANGNQIAISPDEAARRRNAWQNTGTQPASTVSFSSANQPSAAVVANQSLVAPGSTDVVNPASEVNQIDQNAIDVTKQTETGVKGIQDGKLVEQDYRRDKYDRQADRQLRRDEGTAAAEVTDVTQPVDKNLTEEAKRTSIIKQMDTAFRNPETKDRFMPSADENGNNFDRKDFRSDKQYYKNLYPDISKHDVKLISKSFNLGEDPYDMAPGYPNLTGQQKVYESKQDIRDIRQEDRQANRAENKEARQELVSNVKGIFSGKRYEYGGGVDPAALENAIALINRAFGGRIPRAEDGINLGSEDTDGNKIPDYLQFENLPANQPSPFGNNGTIEESAGKKLDINWNQVGAAAGDMYMNAAGKVTNFANKMNAMNPERDMAKMSALNRPSNTYDTMKQGLYDQAGNFIPNDIGNQVLNPTDTMYNNQRQIFAYGGRVYEIGGEVDLADDEMKQLAAAGFKLSRV